MLTTSLRDGVLPWRFQHEYPLVLSDDHLETSWCLYADSKLAAHANLWPRILSHQTSSRSIKIGIVGNVVTHPDFRGCGLMSAVFAHLTSVAKNQDMQALVLWSDLLEFYQKLGFSSIGREIRFVLGASDRRVDTGIRKVDVSQLSDDDLAKMLSLRPAQEWQLNRSITEFRSLLGIPNTALFIRRRGSRITSWFAVGKGSDMQGVIHEWGATSAIELVNDVLTIISAWQLPHLTILTPANLPKLWKDEIESHSTQKSEHNMALGLSFGSNGPSVLSTLARSFLWGFDSI